MRFSWLTLIALSMLSGVAQAQHAWGAKAALASPAASKDVQITDVIPFDQYESVVARIRAIVVYQRELIKKVDEGQDISKISVEQAQKNYVAKLKYLGGLKEQLDNAYRAVDVKSTTEISTTKAVAAEYHGYLSPLFALTESPAGPNFINDCAELNRVSMIQHFNLDNKAVMVAFRGDKVFETFTTLICPKYSK